MKRFFARKTVAFMLAAMLCAVCSFAQQMDEAQIAEALNRVAALLGIEAVDASELKRRVEDIGGLQFRSSVPIDFMSREELSAYIRELFDEEYPSEFAEREERALRAFGLLAENEDLRTIRERVLNENIAGFYDERPGVKKLFAISSGRTLDLMNQLILAHELRHAVQDQHVVIRDVLKEKSDYDDRRLAALSLIEGDASLLMEQYLSAGVTQNQPELATMFQAFSEGLSGPEVAQMFAGPALADAPAVVQEQLVAPYFHGRNLAMAVYQKGGFGLLNQRLKSPPRSMEQVLHPEKYLDAPDEPVDVDPPKANGRDVDFQGRLGELLIRTLLSGGEASAQAASAAAGWGGDAYSVFAEGGSYTLAWRTVWDSGADAREFEQAIRAHMDGWLGSDGYELSTSGREVLLERRGVP